MNPRARPRPETISPVPPHREIMRLTRLGWSPIQIAESLGLPLVSVRGILRAPLIQAELERLQAEEERRQAEEAQP
jgi:hypothetical protein